MDERMLARIKGEIEYMEALEQASDAEIATLLLTDVRRSLDWRGARAEHVVLEAVRRLDREIYDAYLMAPGE